MTKEKMISLTKYLSDLTIKLEADVPTKHQEHPKSYKTFIQNEIAAAKQKLAVSELTEKK